MNRKLMIVIAAIFIVMLGAICVLSYELYEAHRWNDIYFRHMMQAEDELDRVRIINFVDHRFDAAYKIGISRDEVKIDPVVQSHSVTIPNPLFKAPPISQAE